MKANTPRIRAKHRAQRRSRAASNWRGTGSWLGAGAVTLIVAAAAPPGDGGQPVTTIRHLAVALAADTALIVGGSAVPTPPQTYLDAAQNLYLNPLGYGSYTRVPVTTPEQYYPLTGPNSLIADASVAKGVTALDTAIRAQTAAGNKVVVFGYSQGSSVVSQEAANLASSANAPRPDQVSFVLVGNPQTPNGGLNTRYQIPGAPTLSVAGTTFNIAPTTGSPYPTTVYNLEYDLAGDAPQYPLNFLADLNATMGFITLHPGYLNLTPDQINSAVQLPTTGGNTTYYIVPQTNLPLLAPVRLLPLIGNPLADLVQPALKVLVNLGYGSTNNGWSPGPANVVTPIGLFPTNINPTDVLTALINGIPQGITNALNDLKSPQLLDLSPLSLFLQGSNTVGWSPSATPSLQDLVNQFAIIGNTGSPITPANFGSSLLSLPKMLADTTKALTVNLAQYDAQLFPNQLAAGNVLNAVGLPIAVDLGVAPFMFVAGAVFPIAGSVATTVVQAEQLLGLVRNPLAAPVVAASTPVSPATPTPTVTPKVTPGTAQVSIASTKLSPVTAQVSQQTPKVSAVSLKLSPVTAQVTKVTPQVSPLTPKVTTTPKTTSPWGTETNGPMLASANNSTPAADTTTPPAGSHHGKRN